MLQSSLRTGELDVRITIQSYTKTNDSITNEEVLTWSDLATVYAKVVKQKSTETFEARQQLASQVVQYTIRRRTDLNETMRVVDGSTTYYINGIEDFRRQNYMILTCEKRDNE